VGPALILATLALGAPAAKEAPKSPLNGTWFIVSETQDGKATVYAVSESECMTFTADGKVGAHKLNKAPTGWKKYEVNEKTRPRSLDFSYEIRMATQTEYLLFEIDGDTLTLCIGAKGRPESISAKKGSGNVIYVLKRVKAKD
jgi:uncharacterized protein (TIGR03067 family)